MAFAENGAKSLLCNDISGYQTKNPEKKTLNLVILCISATHLKKQIYTVSIKKIMLTDVHIIIHVGKDLRSKK